MNFVRQAMVVCAVSILTACSGGGGGDGGDTDSETPAVDTTAPTLTQVLAVNTPTNDNSPNYTFHSSEAGTISYGGGCSSATTSAVSGNNSISLNTLSDGAYNACTLRVTDASGNMSSILSISAFTIDTASPTLTQVTPVASPTSDTSPSYTFSSSESGAITYGGSCASSTVLAVNGNNVITFNALIEGNYSNCTVRVTDAAGNASVSLTISPFTIASPSEVASKPLNDTGITLCGDYSHDNVIPDHDNNVDCLLGASPQSTTTQEGTEISNGLDVVPAGQDSHFGRDSNPESNTDTDGDKGFSFTKLGANGEELASDATSWSCVLDNVTGLIWEVKTDDDGLQDRDATYTWYNSSGVNDGGDHGIGDTGLGTTTGYQTSSRIYPGTDNCLNNARCDTEKFVQDVNESTLCGASDWRLPTSIELKSLVHFGHHSPAIDTTYFPNTVLGLYWSSTPFADGGRYAWLVRYSDGTESYGFKSDYAQVRLVRNAQ